MIAITTRSSIRVKARCLGRTCGCLKRARWLRKNIAAGRRDEGSITSSKLLSMVSACEPGAVFADEAQFGIVLRILCVNPDCETRHVPDAARRVGVEVGEKHTAIPRQFHAGPIPMRKEIG